MGHRDPSYGAEDTEVPLTAASGAEGPQLWGRGTQLWGRGHQGALNYCFWGRGTPVMGQKTPRCP